MDGWTLPKPISQWQDAGIVRPRKHCDFLVMNTSVSSVQKLFFTNYILKMDIGYTKLSLWVNEQTYQSTDIWLIV